MNEREEAKKHIAAMILTALANSQHEATANPTRSWSIITDAILDQLTLPHSGWALKELSKPAPYQDAVTQKKLERARRTECTMTRERARQAESTKPQVSFTGQHFGR